MRAKNLAEALYTSMFEADVLEIEIDALNEVVESDGQPSQTEHVLQEALDKVAEAEQPFLQEADELIEMALRGGNTHGELLSRVASWRSKVFGIGEIS